MAFIGYAFKRETGRFRNFMAYQRHWLEESGSDDSHGRTLWALSSYDAGPIGSLDGNISLK